MGAAVLFVIIFANGAAALKNYTSVKDFSRLKSRVLCDKE